MKIIGMMIHIIAFISLISTVSLKNYLNNILNINPLAIESSINCEQLNYVSIFEEEANISSDRIYQLQIESHKSL